MGPIPVLLSDFPRMKGISVRSASLCGYKRGCKAVIVRCILYFASDLERRAIKTERRPIFFSEKWAYFHQ